MFAQIFLGIAVIVKGVFHWMNSNIFINYKVKQRINEDQIERFQRGMALPHFLLGMLFISMGIIEKMDSMKTPKFMVIYIILGVIPLGMILVNNKKYSGSYWF